MADFHFERECRTPQSEIYRIMGGDQPVGRFDLHFTATVVHGTLCVIESLTEDDIQKIIQIADEDIVMSADPARDDFIVTVYQGRELGVYSDQDFAENGEDVEGL